MAHTRRSSVWRSAGPAQVAATRPLARSRSSTRDSSVRRSQVRLPTLRPVTESLSRGAPGSVQRLNRPGFQKTRAVESSEPLLDLSASPEIPPDARGRGERCSASRGASGVVLSGVRRWSVGSTGLRIPRSRRPSRARRTASGRREPPRCSSRWPAAERACCGRRRVRAGGSSAARTSTPQVEPGRQRRREVQVHPRLPEEPAVDQASEKVIETAKGRAMALQLTPLAPHVAATAVCRR